MFFATHFMPVIKYRGKDTDRKIDRERERERKKRERERERKKGHRER